MLWGKNTFFQGLFSCVDWKGFLSISVCRVFLPSVWLSAQLEIRKVWMLVNFTVLLLAQKFSFCFHLCLLSDETLPASMWTFFSNLASKLVHLKKKKIFHARMSCFLVYFSASTLSKTWFIVIFFEKMQLKHVSTPSGKDGMHFLTPQQSQPQ